MTSKNHTSDILKSDIKKSDIRHQTSKNQTSKNKSKNFVKKLKIANFELYFTSVKTKLQWTGIHFKKEQKNFILM
jgi:hypothetical protein